MKNIKDYIEFCLSINLYQYPNKIFNGIENHLEKAINQTILDANKKYKNKTNISSAGGLLDLLQFDSTLEVNLLYRIERSIFISDSQHNLLPYFATLMHLRNNCEIYYSTEIGTGLNIQHGFGIVIGPRYQIGKNFTIHQNVTLGQKNLNSPDEKIRIGDNVTIFAGAIVLGNITIGDNAKIAANAVVINDIEPNSIYAGVPAKRVK